MYLKTVEWVGDWSLLVDSYDSGIVASLSESLQTPQLLLCEQYGEHSRPRTPDNYWLILLFGNLGAE